MTCKQTQLLGCTFDLNTKPDKKLATKASLTPIYATNTYPLTHVGTYYILCGMYLVLKTWMIICSNRKKKCKTQLFMHRLQYKKRRKS